MNMKKVSLVMVLSMILLASCNSTGKFDKNLKEAHKEMGITFYASVLMTSDIAKAWQEAIYDNRTPSGKYCRDFNDALEEVMTQKGFLIDSINAHKNKLASATSKLNNPPSDRKDCYNDFIELVSEVNSYANLATSPSGSLRSYSENKNISYTKVMKLMDQFKIKYGEYIKEE